jgi:hypothetical protein
LSVANTQATPKGIYQFTCEKEILSDIHTTPNWCNNTPYKDANGHNNGETVAVFVDCATGGLLPMDQQVPQYRVPGVSLGNAPASK